MKITHHLNLNTPRGVEFGADFTEQGPALVVRIGDRRATADLSTLDVDELAAVLDWLNVARQHVLELRSAAVMRRAAALKIQVAEQGGPPVGPDVIEVASS
jgi:hypothetical protein